MEKQFIVNITTKEDDFESHDLSNVIWRGFESIEGFEIENLSIIFNE